MSAAEPSTINLKIEFGGGLELLFSNQRSHRIALPSVAPSKPATSASTPTAPTRPADVAFLISWLKDNLLTERAELFVDDDGASVRPGILVLINDTDWELEGEGAYEVREGDEVVFISTLHGG